MNGEKIKTDAVLAVADKIKRCNNEMKEGLTELHKTVSSLGSSWEGEAASGALSKFRALENELCPARYTALNNYKCFLMQLVVPGYIDTEDSNTALGETIK